MPPAVCHHHPINRHQVTLEVGALAERTSPSGAEEMVPHEFLKNFGGGITWVESKVEGNSSAGGGLLSSGPLAMFIVTPKHVVFGVGSSSPENWKRLVVLKSAIQ